MLDFIIHKKSILLSVLSGVLVVFAFPNFNVWPLAWVALIPMFFALKNKNLKQTFVLGLIFGLVANLGFLRWLPFSVFNISNSLLPGIEVWIIAVIYPAVSIGIFFLLYSFIQKNLTGKKKRLWNDLLGIISIPAIWVVLEFVQYLLFQGFPFTYDFLGHTQWNNVRIIQVSAFTGVFGVSFLVVLVNLCLYRLWENRKAKEAIFGIVIFAVCLFYGVWIIDFKAPKISENKANMVKAVILDGDIDSRVKWQNKEKVANFISGTYLDLNKKAVAENPNLIVWTETAIPWAIEGGDDLVEASLKITNPTGAFHLIGMPSYANSEKSKYFNSALFFSPAGLMLDRYDKFHLMTFFETGRKIGAINVGNANSRYVQGEKNKLLNTPLGKIAVIICNENLYQDYARRIVNKGAEFIVSIGNDSLLANDTIISQHFAVNYFRAVENRRDIIVANNDGISGAVDAFGRTITVSSENNSHIIPTTIEKRNQKSFYTAYGDVFSYFCVLCGLLGVILSFIPSTIEITQ
ncbi:MAG: apolipoprotein N-acyltransferase [bacterium]|nr:apolipoprotein N-acyltransferase [bacterium]